MSMRRTMTWLLPLWVAACGGSTTFHLSVEFPDQEARDSTRTIWLAIVAPGSEAAICAALQDGFARPGDGGYPIEDELLVDYPPPGEIEALEAAGPGRRLFFAEALDEAGRPLLRGCAQAEGGAGGVQQVAVQLAWITPPGVDQDQDGFRVPADCVDTDDAIHPGAEELCDDLDNDCDGERDEGVNCPCSPGTIRDCWPQWLPEPAPGSPCRIGTQACGPVGWESCTDLVLPSGVELCVDGGMECAACLDQADNDCDGFLDGQDTGCGGCEVGTWAVCYEGPAGSENYPPCAPGLRHCSDGYPLAGECEGQTLPALETCNTVDDDCDGNTDQDTAETCALTLGVCAGARAPCLDGAPQECAAEDYEQHARARLCQGAEPPACCTVDGLACYALEETSAQCDGEDNDCDGLPDNPMDGACACEAGRTLPCPSTSTGDPDEGDCSAGLFVCTEGAWTMDADCVPPAPEQCDGLDNDCDGTSDQHPDANQHCVDALAAAGKTESYQATPLGCVLGVCRFVCLPGHWDLQLDRDQPPDGLALADGCEYACALSQPLVERCDLLDNDCDGLTDAQDTGTSLATLCPARTHAGVTACLPGTGCDYTCQAPYEDCDGDLYDPVPLDLANETSDGCEINLGADTRNCGSCGNGCGQNAYCNVGSCVCDPGWANCHNGWADGCETALGTLSDCLTCGDACGDGSACADARCDEATGCSSVNQPAGMSCGDPTDSVCTDPDTCDGGGHCQVNHAPSSTVCRAVAGTCDVAETCTGSSANCPADTFHPASHECRTSAGPCDAAENCTGSSPDCPSNLVRPSTYECRASAGTCDLAENCTGSSASCPADAFRPSSYECRPATGVCDTAENCPGSSAACPANGWTPDGTDCGSTCNGLNYSHRACQTGACIADATFSCYDGVSCTTDSCIAPTGCVNADNCTASHTYCSLSLEACVCWSGWDDCEGDGSCDCEHPNVCQSGMCMITR